MSRWERYGTRDLTFSNWHRTALPDYCSVIDLDFLEYCHRCRKPLALIELARDVGQKHKPTRVMEELAKLAGIEAYLIIWQKVGDSVGDCRMARIWPNRTELHSVSADRVALVIKCIHQRCPCSAKDA